jgi:hypothetical protein
MQMALCSRVTTFPCNQAQIATIVTVDATASAMVVTMATRSSARSYKGYFFSPARLAAQYLFIRRLTA